jgi:nitrite reductase (NADH) small subunit
MAKFIAVAKVDEIPEGKGKMVEVNGRRISVWNAGGAFFAVDNSCPHRGAPLHEGDLHGRVVTCSWHHWEINLETGETPNPAAKQPTYPVRVENGEIKIAV